MTVVFQDLKQRGFIHLTVRVYGCVNEINYKSYGEYLDKYKVMASGEYGRVRNCMYRLYQHTNVLTHMRIRRLQWAGHVARMLDNGTNKEFWKEVSTKKPAGKPRNRWKDEVLNDAVKLLIRKKWRAAGRRRGDWRKKPWEVMARKRVEQPQEEEEEDDDDDDDDDND
jgi:hypothetical protein